MDFKEKDVIRFKNNKSGTTFKAEVKKDLGKNEYRLYIIESTNKDFIGQVHDIDFGNGLTRKNFELIEVEGFEKKLAIYEAAKYLNCCHQAVNTNDKQWFEESHAQYTLWLRKAESKGEDENEL